MKNLDNDPIDLLEPSEANIADLQSKTLPHDLSEKIIPVNQTTQDLFHDQSGYQKFLTYLSQKHGLTRPVLQPLVHSWDGDKDDTRMKIFGTAFVDHLQRVHAQLSSFSAVQLNILNSFRPNQTRLHLFTPIQLRSLSNYSKVICCFICYLFQVFKKDKLAKAIFGSLLSSSKDFRNIIREMKAIPLPEGQMDLWKDQQEEKICKLDTSLESENSISDDEDEDREYVFTEDLYSDDFFPPLNSYNTHNHLMILEMEEKCYSPTPALKALQQLLLKLMQFIFTHHLDVDTAASPLYSFLAINGIHSSDLDQMRDAAFFSAKYSALIYCSVLLTISISLREYVIPALKDSGSEPSSLTKIIRRFTDQYCKNDSASILSHLHILRALAFRINKNKSKPPSIVIVDKEKAIIRCEEVEISWENMRTLFETVARDAYHHLTSDLLLGIDLQKIPSLSCKNFAQYEDYSNEYSGVSVFELSQNVEVELLQSTLLKYIIGTPSLKAKFVDMKQQWSPPKVSLYINHVHQFLRTLMLLIHLAGSLPSRASELGTAKYMNSWTMLQRNLFLDPESELYLLRLTYHKTVQTTGRPAKGAHFLPPCVSYILLVYLGLVLPFIKTLEKRIQKSGGQSVSPLLFNIDQRPMGAPDLAKAMIKYSLKCFGQRMLPRIYRHIIIAMTKLRTDLVIDDKTGCLVLTNKKDISSELGAMQAHHGIGTREMQYARDSHTMKDIPKGSQELLLQYCRIYHTAMGFDNITFCQEKVFPPSTPTSRGFSAVTKHQRDPFSPSNIIDPGKRLRLISPEKQPIFGNQRLLIPRKPEHSFEDPFI